MKSLFKGALKVFFDYCLTLLVFVIFLYTFINITKDNYLKWLPIYSFLIFILMFVLIYSDMSKSASREKKTQGINKAFVLKGLLMGFIGFLPFILLEMVFPFIMFDSDIAERIGHNLLSMMMGPVYFVIRLGGYSTWAYAAASLIPPIIAALGYAAGYYGFNTRAFFKKIVGR